MPPISRLAKVSGEAIAAPLPDRHAQSRHRFKGYGLTHKDDRILRREQRYDFRLASSGI